MVSSNQQSITFDSSLQVVNFLFSIPPPGSGVPAGGMCAAADIVPGRRGDVRWARKYLTAPGSVRGQSGYHQSVGQSWSLTQYQEQGQGLNFLYSTVFC